MKKEKRSILKNMEYIALKLKAPQESQYTDFTKEVMQLDESVGDICAYLACPPNQAALFCVVMYLTLMGSRIQTREIQRHIRCSPFDAIELDRLLKELADRRLLVRTTNSKVISERNFTIPEKVMEKISNEEELDLSDDVLDIFSLGEKFDLLFYEKQNGDIDYEGMIYRINLLKETNKALPIFQVYDDLELNVQEEILLLYIFAKTCLGYHEVQIEQGINRLISPIREKIETKRRFLLGKSILFERKIIEQSKDAFVSGTQLLFTKPILDRIFGDDAQFLRAKSVDHQGSRLIESDSIPAVDLFYSKDIQSQMELIQQVLLPGKYEEALAAMESKGMKGGFTVLFHGFPGTGKTESIYQIAKKTGRQIFFVELTQIKDKWVGESEKKLKEVFDSYRAALKKLPIAPILLFNECDSIIGKRINVSNSVDQMNNSMQNILLQEIEDFKGILFATTNLTKNLDDAFDRRFLYKVKFEKPAPEVIEKIWKQKFDFLSDDDARLLSTNFSFSGGQIDNIYRKSFLDRLMKGGKGSYDELFIHCENELMKERKGKSKRQIGFQLSNNQEQ